MNPFDIPSEEIQNKHSPDLHLIIGYHAHLWYMYKGK